MTRMSTNEQAGIWSIPTGGIPTPGRPDPWAYPGSPDDSTLAPDPSAVLAVAEALDTTIDEAADAVEAGDLATASTLLGTADAATDQLLNLLGHGEANDETGDA